MGRIGGQISVVTEWLGKQILEGFATVSDKSRGHKHKKVQHKTAKEMVSDCIKITCGIHL